jgi:hypothetical protein
VTAFGRQGGAPSQRQQQDVLCPRSRDKPELRPFREARGCGGEIAPGFVNLTSMKYETARPKGVIQEVRVAVDSDDATLRANQLGSKYGYIAGSAA